MIHALDRLRQLTIGAVAALLVATLVLVVVRGIDDPTTSAGAPPRADEAGESDAAGPVGPARPGDAADGDLVPGATTEDGRDLVLVSEEVALSPAGSTSPSTPSTPSSGPGVPSTPVTTAPRPTVPVTPTTPPTSPPVTPPTPPGPTTPTPPPKPTSPPAKPAVVDVAVLSGGQLLTVDVNLAAPNLVNLSVLQP